MRRIPLLAPILAFVLTAVPLLAGGDPIFNSGVGRQCMIDVLRKSEWGLVGQFERAAFVVEHDDGSLECELWPSTHAFRSESFHGTVPPGTVAIVHSHPAGLTAPSYHDMDLARRLGIPNYVLTINGVTKAVPGSMTAASVVHGYGWFNRKIAQTARAPSRPAIHGPALSPSLIDAGPPM